MTGPGTFCGIDVGITPFVTGGPFGGFQSVAGTGFQDPITITFSQPITWASVKILDPDYPDFIRVYDDYVAYDKLQIVPAGCTPPLK